VKWKEDGWMNARQEGNEMHKNAMRSSNQKAIQQKPMTDEEKNG
jgi:hypothetical protein